jgi:hypothetical protein
MSGPGAERLTKADRQDLARLARLRGKQARTEADQRTKVLAVEVEDLLTAEFSARDELWAEATAIAQEAVRKANELIVARCADLGIPAKYAPRVEVGWEARSFSFSDSKRRGELRKLAEAKLAALAATAKTAIDAKTLEVETALITGGLESGEARAFLDAMPTAEQLMPALGLDDIGVKHWQPPTDAAAGLLTPSTPADRRRKLILRAIEANPDASDRKLAEIAGCDHKTVAAYRRNAGEAAGEIPTETHGAGKSGGVPTEDGAP